MILTKNLLDGEGYADPHAIVVDGRVYLFCGRDWDGKIEEFCRMPKWTIVSSDDLVNWRVEADILPKDTYMGCEYDCWAGHIIKKDDTYYWYFSNKNYDIGVMTSKCVTGPYVDALGKPLVPMGFADTKSYDPTILEDNGKHYMMYGNGTYYCVELGEDMISLASEAEMILVTDENGEKFRMNDKPNLFKRGDWYYIASGDKYAMSKNIKGPYVYKGKFVEGGHSDYFKFNGKEYLAFEHHFTNIFYRGVAVTELFFNEDGTFIPQEEKIEEFFDKKTWDFSESDLHWFMTDGSDAKHIDSAIEYDLNEFVGFRGPVFPNFKTDKSYKFILELEKGIDNATLRVKIDSVASEKGYSKDTDTYTKTIFVPLSSDKNIYEIEVKQNEFRMFKCFKMYAYGFEDRGTIRIKRITITK